MAVTLAVEQAENLAYHRSAPGPTAGGPPPDRPQPDLT
jgi:hypothetical protein